MSGSEGRAGMRWREREKERMRGGRRVVLKMVRYSTRRGGKRYAKQRGMCMRERVRVKEGDWGEGGVYSQHKENIKKEGNE